MRILADSNLRLHGHWGERARERGEEGGLL